MNHFSSGRPAHLLVIDNDPGVLELLSHSLASYGYQVDYAPDLPAGLELALAHTPDLALLDLQLPLYSGLDVLAVWQAHPILVTVPVIGLTSLPNFALCAAALRRGACDCIIKPFSPEELHIRINVHLRAAADRRALLAEQRRSALLYDIARDLGSSQVPDDLLHRLVSNSVVAIGATSGTIIVLSGYNGPTTAISIHQCQPDPASLQRILQAGLAGWVIGSGRPALIADVLEDQRWLQLQESPSATRSAIAVPIFGNPQDQTSVDGVLTLVHTNPSAFTPDDLSLLEIVVEQAGVALRHARQYERERYWAGQLATLVNVAAAVSRSADLHEKLFRLADATMRLLHSEYALIELFDALTHQLTVQAAVGSATGALAQRTPLHKSPLRALFEQPEQLLLLNGAGTPSERRIRPAEARHSIAIAIGDRDQIPIGALWCGHNRTLGYSQDDLQILKLLAQQTLAAIQNERLYSVITAERRTLQTVLASARDGILVLDAARRGRLINPAASRALNLAPVAFIGRRLDQLNLPYPLHNFLSTADEKAMLTIDLGGRSFQVLVAPVNRTDAGVVAVLNDITHFKTLDMLKSQFVSDASHDLKSPLSIIAGYAQALRIVGLLNERQEHFVARIEQNVQRLVDLVSNLLDLSTIELLTVTRLEIFDLVERIRNISGDYEVRAQHARLNLVFDLPDEPLLVNANPVRIQQVFDNLLTNAIKYTLPGGTVVVALWCEANQAICEVRDTGIGIPEADRPHIFERFYRVKGAYAREIEGTGLGLAIVKSVVEASGGWVDVTSKVGSGSVFRVTLPLHQL